MINRTAIQQWSNKETKNSLFLNLCHSLAYPCHTFAEKIIEIWTTTEGKV